jgi:hypothetical protein
MDNIFKFNLGDEVKDSITGFSGIITARTQFLNGCIRYGITCTKLNKDGIPLESEYFDEQQLELVKKTKTPVKEDDLPGGPAPVTPQYSN